MPYEEKLPAISQAKPDRESLSRVALRKLLQRHNRIAKWVVDNHFPAAI